LQDKSFINNYKKQYKEIVLESIKCMSQNDIKIFEEILEQYEFNDMLKSINDIIIFTQFNDPILFFSIESNYENRKMKYLNINNDNKKNYIIVNDLGNSNINNNSLILLEPPCMKSGHTFFNELKPIIILIEIENQKDIINLEDSKKEINLSKERQIIDEPNKFNYLNKTNKINKILNLYLINDNNKIDDKNCFKFYSNNKNIANNCFTDSFKNFNYDMIGLCGDSSFEEDNKKYITSINSSSRTEDKKYKKINVTKEINSDENEFNFNSTTDNLGINKLNSKQTIVINHFAKVYNKIHRIKSANNYFDKNLKQIRKDNIKCIKKKKNLIKKEVLNKIYNKYKQYVISKNKFRFKKKLVESNNTFGNQSLSIKKTFQKPPTSKHHIISQIKKLNKNYNSSSSIKTNLINMDTSKRKNQLNSQFHQNNLNNQFLKICRTNINIRGNKNLYKDSFLKINQKNEIISSSKTKENITIEKEQNLKRNKMKNIKNKFQNIKINYSNYNNNRNITNINTSTKPNHKSKRIDTYEQKNSFLYSTLEDLKKMMNDTNKSIIMISTNSYINNNTININNNKKSKKKIRKSNQERNKDIIKKFNFNTINNSIRQLISLPYHKTYENDYINYNSIELNDYNKNSFNQNYNNKDIYYKYFSTDESEYNKLNIINNFKNKSNSKSKNKNYKHYKIPKYKEDNILNENGNNSKLNNINNLSYINKKRIKDIQINIDGLNNNERVKNSFNTIVAKKNEFRFRKICHNYGNNKF
jgi:CCR4-NOT transcription complex subunit 7/8